MPTSLREETLRIGELAARAGTSADTVRYYEQLGLLKAPDRSDGGYRLYSQAELRRLQFIRRAKLLGLSLEEIRGLLGLAEEGECRPLRSQVAELLRRKIEECEAKLAELRDFKASLEERYRMALESQDLPACSCSTFPASCACLPVQIQEVSPSSIEVPSASKADAESIDNTLRSNREMDARTIITTEQALPRESEELKVLNTGCGCGCDGNCGCGSVRAQPRAEQSCDCGCTPQSP